MANIVNPFRRELVARGMIRGSFPVLPLHKLTYQSYVFKIARILKGTVDAEYFCVVIFDFCTNLKASSYCFLYSIWMVRISVKALYSEHRLLIYVYHDFFLCLTILPFCIKTANASPCLLGKTSNLLKCIILTSFYHFSFKLS